MPSALQVDQQKPSAQHLAPVSIPNEVNEELCTERWGMWVMTGHDTSTQILYLTDFWSPNQQ